MAANSATKQRRRGTGRPFQPGQSGNPSGKPKGARHRTTLLAEQLFEGEAATITRKVIERAKRGDMTALRLCLDRIVPPRRERAVRFKLPVLSSASGAAAAVSEIVKSVAAGELTPAEAAELVRLLETYVKLIEASEFERRLEVLEQRQDREEVP